MKIHAAQLVEGALRSALDPGASVKKDADASRACRKFKPAGQFYEAKGRRRPSGVSATRTGQISLRCFKRPSAAFPRKCLQHSITIIAGLAPERVAPGLPDGSNQAGRGLIFSNGGGLCHGCGGRGIGAGNGRSRHIGGEISDSSCGGRDG